jgi:serine/threonine protein kinase
VTAAYPTPALGERIGPFRLVTPLGEGGFAPVYLASEEYGGVEVRVVALKLFFMDRVGPEAFDAIVAEARALSRVEHRSVVRYFQIYEDEGRRIVALAMEHVRGDSLAHRLEQRGALSVPDTLAVGAAIASALAAVHASGLVHRDVKPDNVIDAGGVYKLIDFGIATMQRSRRGKAIAPASVDARGTTDVGMAEERTLVLGPPRATAAQMGAPRWQEQEAYLAETMTVDDGTGDVIAGTMGYIDPECLKGAPPDPTSDLYGLGAMLYECLSRRLPASPRAQSTQLHQAIAFGIERPPPLCQIAPEVPEAVGRLVDALVDPDRARRPKHAEAVLAEIERLRRGVGRPRALPEEGPFRGLAAFDERHRDVFFGRSSDLALALDALRARGVLALIGPSGSGKSSLARAGVVPAVVDGELGGWPKRYEAFFARPGPFPRVAIDLAFARSFGPGTASASPDAFVATLSARVEAAECGIVLYLDALEELITLSTPAERDWLAEVLARFARTPMPGLRVVVSARRDFLDQLLAVPALGPALARTVQLVAPLGGRAFAEAIEDRLAVYGYSLEDAAMFEVIARELDGAPEAMPLFEFALARLWTERDQSTRRLTRAALARIGGIAGALEQHAEQTLATLVAQHGPGIEATTRGILLALTTASGTRTRKSREEVGGDPRLAGAVLSAFEQARLVVVEEGKLTLAHEALLARWPRLASWVQSVKKERELAEETEQAATRWKERREERSLLMRGRALREAQELMRAPTTALSPNALAFLRASNRAEKRGVTGVVVLVSLVMIGLVVLYGLGRTLDADARKREREADAFASKLKKTQETPESERVLAIKKLIAEKNACEHELQRCAGDAGRD